MAAGLVVDDVVGPPVGLLGVVAGLAEALSVVHGGLSTRVAGGDVVDVADRGVAPGGAADALVAQGEEVGESVGGEPLPTGHRDETSGGVGVEVADEGDGLGAQGVGDDLAGDLGGDHASGCVGEGGGCVAGAEEGLVGDDDVDGDAHVLCVALAGEAFDEEVGHDLALGACVAVGDEAVCLLGEAREGLDAWSDREESGEVDHRVRGRADADPAGFGGLGVAAGNTFE
ncbi:hypothetical protein [Nocardioides sp.]|uniref:hypothetical protein n=1 Tax=Nocardioides sp. TaxID=35761 RepID=UPI003218F9E3